MFRGMQGHTGIYRAKTEYEGFRGPMIRYSALANNDYSAGFG